MIGQDGYVCLPFSERRKMDRYYIDAVKEILSESFSATAFSKSWFVAVIILTSTSMVFMPPIRSNCLSCITLNTFTCNEGLMSPISSRKIVPPLANSNLPVLPRMAPVKAPFS